MITKCRLCYGEIADVLSFKGMANTSSFPKPDQIIAVADMDLVRCLCCGLVQLRQVYDKDLFYKSDIYGYRSGLNQSMVKHLSDVVRIASCYVDAKSVLDIGSNDGTLLSNYDDGVYRVGIDPTITKFGGHYNPGIRKIPDYFSPGYFGSKFNVIYALSMLYDLEEPLEFMSDVASLLSDKGIIVLEFGYLMSMIRNNAYDTICHEHVEYYGISQIYYMAQACGLNINRIELSHVNGGSALVVLSRHLPSCLDLGDYIKAEESLDFSGFRESISLNIESVLITLNDIKRQGKTVVGYGASTKGNTLLQVCGITRDLLPCIIEINEDKIGRVTPGSGIPIVRHASADYYFVLPWHFRENIIHKEKKFLDDGGGLIFPLPMLEVVCSRP